jgi:hypothetical protein
MVADLVETNRWDVKRSPSDLFQFDTSLNAGRSSLHLIQGIPAFSDLQNPTLEDQMITF